MAQSKQEPVYVVTSKGSVGMPDRLLKPGDMVAASELPEGLLKVFLAERNLVEVVQR